MSTFITPKRSQSIKSVRSNRSMKSMPSMHDAENILDFDDLVTNGCAKFNCRTVVLKDYQFDEYLKCVKQPQISGRVRRLSAAPGFGKTVITPVSDKGVTTLMSDIQTVVSEDDTSVVTAVYNSTNKLCEILIQNQKLLPRVLIQTLGLVAPFFTQLTKMSIKNCILNGYTIYEMAQFLPLTLITEICLDGSSLYGSDYALLLEKPSRITNLSLCRCNISDEDCNLIMSKLHFLEPVEQTLTVLNLSSNHITDEGAKSIGEALRTNRHLRYLNLADNWIGDAGANHILHALMDFTVTCDEIVCKRRRFIEYHKEKQDFDNIHATKMKPAEDLNAYNKKPRSPKVKKSKPNFAKEELFMDPFSPYNTKLIDGHLHCVGNMSLCYLNLSYNNLSYISVEKLRSVLLYQNTNKKLGQIGLLKVVIDGNPIPVACDVLDSISAMLQKNVNQFSTRLFKDRRKSRTSTLGARVSVVSDTILAGEQRPIL